MDRTMAPSAGAPAPDVCAKTSPAPKAADLRFILRDATDVAHRRLDAGFAAYDLTRRADYLAFLMAMQAAFAPLEAWLDETDPGFLPMDWSQRRRAEALRVDLQGLGIVASEGSSAVPPPTLPADAAPGVLYVLEGSRLGGQVLLRQVLASPDPVVRENARFLRHGEGLRFWPSFSAWLCTRPVSEHEPAISGALCAFALFERTQANR
jgi:heme oxygenase